MKKLDPKCLNNKMQVALTNKGELIPCCYCDTKLTRQDPKFQQLLKVSKISNYDTIEEIYLTKEWIDFKKDLENDKGPFACFNTCPKKDDKIEDGVRKETIYENGKVVWQNKQ